MLVATALIMGLFAMSLLVTAYRAHAIFLRARSVVARETVGAITADFSRALALTLALATRSYYDSDRFSDFTSRFENYGLNPRDLESAKRVAFRYLDIWSRTQRIVYAESGIQVSWRPCVSDVSHLLERRAYVFDFFLIHWNGTISGSYACAKLTLNLTSKGFYHWTVNTLVGLTLKIDEVNTTSREVIITVNVDNGTYYGLLIVKGWVEVYLSSTSGQWMKASIRDVTYEGRGRYRLRLVENLGTVNEILVIVSDDRGILVLGLWVNQGSSDSSPSPPGRRR